MAKYNQKHSGFFRDSKERTMHFHHTHTGPPCTDSPEQILRLSACYNSQLALLRKYKRLDNTAFFKDGIAELKQTIKEDRRELKRLAPHELGNACCISM